MSDINTLRTALFETLQGIKDGKLDLDKAKAINETAQTIINTAKVEVDYARVTGAQLASQFLQAPALPRPGGTTRPAAVTQQNGTIPSTGPRGSL